MANSKKRIVVDGIDFAAVFRFPRSLKSATAAMHPPRLIVALLTVVLLLVFGRTWDSATTPTVRPGGLLAGAMTPDEADGARDLMWRAITKYVPEDERPARERQVYELIDAAGHSKVAAARELGCSEAYVRQKLLPRLHTALAQCLAQKGFREAESIAEGAS